MLCHLQYHFETAIGEVSSLMEELWPFDLVDYWHATVV